MQVLCALTERTCNTCASIESHTVKQVVKCFSPVRSKVSTLGRRYLLINYRLHLVVEAASRATLYCGLGEVCGEAMGVLYYPTVVWQVVGDTPIDGPTKIIDIHVANHADGHANGRLCKQRDGLVGMAVISVGGRLTPKLKSPRERPDTSSVGWVLWSQPAWMWHLHEHLTLALPLACPQAEVPAVSTRLLSSGVSVSFPQRSRSN